MFLYKVETVPPISADASKTWNRLIKTVSRQLERDIGLITFRADTLWAERPVDKPLKLVTSLGGRRKKPRQPREGQEGMQLPQYGQTGQSQQPAEVKYELTLTQTKRVHFDDLFNEENKSVKPLFIQMVNNKIK